MRQFYFSFKQVKHDYSLLRAYAVSCGRFNITVNRDYLHAQNQGKLASVCLQQFSSIFETTIHSCLKSVLWMFTCEWPEFYVNKDMFCSIQTLIVLHRHIFKHTLKRCIFVIFSLDMDFTISILFRYS